MIKNIFLVALISTAFIQAARSCRTLEEQELEEQIQRDQAESARQERIARIRFEQERQAEEAAKLAAEQERARFLEQQQPLERHRLEFGYEQTAREQIVKEYDQASNVILALMKQAKND